MNRFALFSLGFLLLAGCGGGGADTTSGGGTTTSPKLTLSQVQTAVKAMSDKMVSLNGKSRSQRRSEFLTWVRTQPTTAEAGVATLGDNLYVKFTDGTFFPIFDNLGDGEPKRREGLVLPEPKIANLPQDLKAWSGHSLRGGPFAQKNDDVGTWLGSAGYQVTTLPTVTVANILSGWNGAGVVYWEAHAGSLPVKQGLQDMVLLTDEEVTAAKEAAYKTYLDRLQVSYGGLPIYDALGNLKEVRNCYAITPTFIAQNVRFASNAVVAVMGCTSGDRAVWNAMQLAGVGTYIGNDAPATGSMPERYALLFDRLLGENFETPISDPEERSFNMTIVQSWMQNKAFDADPALLQSGRRAKMVWYYNGGTEGFILKPTIYRVLKEFNAQGQNFVKWYLEGDFGPDQGRGKSIVKWAGVEQEVLEWTPQYIRVKVPNSKPYPVGSLQVITQERESNRVPMTEWSVPFTYTLTGRGTLKLELKGTLRFRGDVRPTRVQPQEPLELGSTIMSQLVDSEGTLTASGTYRENNTTYTWSGTRNLRSAAVGSAGPDEIIFDTQFNARNFTFEQTSLAAVSSYTETQTSNGSSQTITKSFGLDGIPFINTYSAQNGSYAFVGKTIPGSNLSERLAVSSSLRLDSATPQFAPNALTQSRPVKGP